MGLVLVVGGERIGQPMPRHRSEQRAVDVIKVVLVVVGPIRGRLE